MILHITDRQNGGIESWSMEDYGSEERIIDAAASDVGEQYREQITAIIFGQDWPESEGDQYEIYWEGA